MKSFLEWYLGIAPAQPGQGTRWSWQHQAPWPAWMPQWMVLVVSVAAIIYLGWVYRKDAQNASTGMRIGLTLLRLSVLVAVLLVLSELTLVVDRTGLPWVAVLIDDSASMGLEDRYDDAAEKSAVDRLSQASGSKTRSRLAIAQGLLTQDDAAFLKQLQAGHQLKVYRFSESAVAVATSDPDATSEEKDPIVAAIRALKADGDVTRPAEAVRKVLADFRGSLPSAIVILSDGITSSTDADRLSVVAETAAQRLVPIYTVGIGSEEAMHDLNLFDVLVDDVAFVGDPITFTGKLRSSGFKGKKVTIELRRKGSRQALTRKKVTAAEDGQTLPIEITWIPEEAGEYEFILEAVPQRGESDEANNAEVRQVSVREGRIRVLLADLEPRWEFRELKTLLEREKTVDLHTVLQEADLEYADQDVTAAPLRGRLPVNAEQLNGYDVIILGDLNPQYLTTGSLETLRNFVRDSGGGLIMIAGTQHNPVQYCGTPLEALLPIELDGVEVPSPDVPLPNEIRPQLTVEGRKSTPIFRFDANEQDSDTVWKNLPGFYWMISAPRVKAGATVFVEHPTRMGDGRKLPIILMHRFGAGKVLFHATDETWLWRRKVGDLYFGRYWIQAIRYLSRTRLLGQSKSAELRSDRLVYQRGDAVNLRVRFYDEKQIPKEKDGVAVIVERRGAGSQEVALVRVPQAPNVFEGQLRRAVDGSYHAWVARPEFPENSPSTDFRIEAPVRELKLRGMDRAELSRAAVVTRGRYYGLATASSLPEDIPRGRPVAIHSEDPIRIWNRWEVLVVFCTLLTIEWLLRKRLRLV
ncbi:MAG: hypothetical protein O3C17_05950 [Planctomycetota bacterium]|nr:hypothetical protein [Planctomycetota bacterium]